MENKTHKRWTVKGFAEGFVKNTLGKKKKEENYSVALVNGVEALIYTAFCNNKTEIEGTDTLAVRLANGVVLANSARLRWGGTRMHWGRRGGNWGFSAQVPVQKWLDEAGATSVPFDILVPKTENGEASSQRDPQFDKVQIVEKCPAEEIIITVRGGYKPSINDYEYKDEKRHYTGACLMRIEEDYYLFDIDRNELEHKIFNPFMVKLAKPAKTVAEAYEGLIPDSVKQAKESGVDVQRQGEWFFIKRFEELPNPLSGVPKEVQDRIDNPPDARKMGFPDLKFSYNSNIYKPGDWCNTSNMLYGELRDAYEDARIEWENLTRSISNYSVNRGQLRQGQGRPNNVEKFVIHNGVSLCFGTISHTGREHKDLILTGWYEPVPNTAVNSWQISGDID